MVRVKHVVDGTTITLGGNSSGTTTTNGMTYNVSISSGTATITLTKAAGVSVSNVNSLVNGMTYQNTSIDAPSAGSRVFTITSAQDNGAGSDTASLSIASSVNVIAVNDAPSLGGATQNGTYIENQSAMVIDGVITVADLDSPANFNGGYIQVSFHCKRCRTRSISHY